MKKLFLLCSLFSGVCMYAQLSGNYVSEKFSLGYNFGAFPGCYLINENEIVAGRFIVDNNGKKTGTIPDYLAGNFSFCSYGPIDYTPPGGFSLNSGTAKLVSFSEWKTLKNSNKSEKVKIDVTSSFTNIAKNECFKTRGPNAFVPDKTGQSSFGMYVHMNKVQAFNQSGMVTEITLSTVGKRWDDLHVNGVYYSLYGCENALILNKLELETGKEESLTIDNNHPFYFGGKLRMVDDHLMIACFYGNCEPNNAQDTYKTQDEGVVFSVVDLKNMKEYGSGETKIPSEYLDAYTSEGYSYLRFVDIIKDNDSYYFVNSNTDGPFGVWQYDGGSVSYIFIIEPKEKGNYVTSAKLFNYNGSNYLLSYERKKTAVLQEQFMRLPQIGTFNQNGFSPMTLDIAGFGKDRGDLNLNYSYLTNNGVIIIPSSYPEANMGYLVTIKL